MWIFLLILVIIVIGSFIFVALNLPFNKDDYKKCQFYKKTIKIEDAKCRYCKKYLLQNIEKINE